MSVESELRMMQAQIVALRQSLADLESLSSEPGEFELQEWPEQELNEYDGPFRVWGESSPTPRIRIGQGFVHAGARAEWDWPSAAAPVQQDFILTGAVAPGVYLVVLSITVDPFHGYFTQVDYPRVMMRPRAQFTQVNTESQAEAILAEVTIGAAGRGTRVVQRQRCDVVCPTFAYFDTTDDVGWVATWTRKNQLITNAAFIYGLGVDIPYYSSPVVIDIDNDPTPHPVERHGGRA